VVRETSAHPSACHFAEELDVVHATADAEVIEVEAVPVTADD
jgi:hypothetical protein